MHDLRGESEASGTAASSAVPRGWPGLPPPRSWFPPAAADVPVTVRFAVRGGVETWTRTFGAAPVLERAIPGGPRGAPAVRALRAGDLCDGARLRRWPSNAGAATLDVFGIPLPLRLGPRASAFEFSEHGRFHFHVEISHPLVGLIVRYQGSLSSPQPV